MNKFEVLPLTLTSFPGKNLYAKIYFLCKLLSCDGIYEIQYAWFVPQTF